MSIGTSLLIENTFGNVSLESVVVESNRLLNNFTESGKSFAGGVSIMFNSSLNDLAVSDYRITNCEFKNIITPNCRSYDDRHINTTINEWVGYGLGGGLSIILDEESSHIFVFVRSCIFWYNTAPWGAGMYVSIQKNASFNSVYVQDSNFVECKATVGCGGIDIGSTKRSPSLNNNTVIVNNSLFIKNDATNFGGGACVFTFSFNIVTENDRFVTFWNCSWMNNTARYSPAVDVSPSRFNEFSGGAFPIPIFRDCTFINNKILWRQRHKTNYITSGVFVITQFTVSFQGKLYFDSNVYTALLLSSGKVTLEENTYLQFVNNTGLQGGAVALHGYSYISISDNCRVEFINNRATEYGGAIFYYPIEQREFFIGRVCFLRYRGDHNSPVDGRNISFAFVNNSAGVSGSSIYATSLYACYYTYRGAPRRHTGKFNEFVNKIGNFSLTNDSTVSLWGTTGHFFIADTGSQVFETLPGMKLTLPLKVKDELDQRVKSPLFV